MQQELTSGKYPGRIKEIYLVIAGLITTAYVLTVHQFTFEEAFIIGYQLYLLFRFINNIGYTICFFDFLCFYSAMDTLLMPIVGYRVFNYHNRLARLWGLYMRVPQEEYYSYLIPANLALFFGLNLLVRKFKVIHFKLMLARLADHAKDKGRIGIVLTIIGFAGTFLESFQSNLSFVFHLLSMLKYVGPIYVYFSDLSFRRNAFILSMVAFLVQAVIQGMFGQFVMYLVLSLLVVSIKFNFRFFNKLIIFCVGFFLVVVLQSIKNPYRVITWRGEEMDGLSLETSSRVEIFGSLFWERLTNVSTLMDQRTSFFVYTRLNQGYLISRAMNYVPKVEPYAEGETIVRSVAAILVPRIMWPDKPEAGGRENLSRFLGIKRKLNYSMNIGPYGEAYGNFGPAWGVAFIFVYGLFLSWLFKVLLKYCIKRPTLVVWTPLLFFSTLTVETDILSTLNAFVKGAVFVVILFWLAKKFFKVDL